MDPSILVLLNSLIDRGLDLLSSQPRKEFQQSNVIYVGNLDYETTEAQLREAFAVAGKVLIARVARKPKSGLSKGYGFVAMQSIEEAGAAVAALHQVHLDDREIVVKMVDANRLGK